MLSENATQVGHACFGAAIGLFARPPRQCLFAHGHAGAIGTDIHDRRGPATGLRRPFLPLLGRGSHPLHHALDLPGGNVDAAGFRQVLLGLLVTGFIGSLQTHQPGQGWGVPRL